MPYAIFNIASPLLVIAGGYLGVRILRVAAAAPAAGVGAPKETNGNSA